ncbi:MAG TPA: single-stranded DNA-binding protein [Salinivirgaceae bacterium]|nr:single-stranded DNA-binding protein [Salinivirgaceae bacterium]
MSLNKVILLGRAGKDPDIRHFETNSVANFSLATNERYRDRTGTLQERTDWHNIVVGGRLAKVVEDYVKKGTQLLIEGKIRTRKYESQGQDRYITEIITERLVLLARPQGGEDKAQQGFQDSADSFSSDETIDNVDIGDDLPF